MKQIELTYRKNGAIHTQIHREGNVAIYELTSPETGRVLAYEVFEIKQNPERTIGGKQIAASESTPSNEEWGYLGYTVWAKSAAFSKANLLLKNIESRKEAKRKTLKTIQ